MSIHHEIEEKIKKLLKLRLFEEAKKELNIGLGHDPVNVKLLILAIDVFRASGDLDQSLKHVEDLISNHPLNWVGYRRYAQILVELKRFDEAKEKLRLGLEKIPYHYKLLNTATSTFLASGDIEKSLEYADLLIFHHPKLWIGYSRAAEILIDLKRFNEAQSKLDVGLIQCPNEIHLLALATDVFIQLSDFEKSREYAELLIANYPDDNTGYVKLIEMGFRYESIDLLRKRLKLNPENNELAKLKNRHFLELDDLYEDKTLKLQGVKNPGSAHCIVAFTGAGDALGAIGIIGSNFAGTEFEDASVFVVVDKEKSWSNRINEKVLKKKFSMFGSFSKVIAIGTSMGGTNALILGPLLNAETIIAFSPQYTVFPKYNLRLYRRFNRNSDSRIASGINNIKKWKYKSLSDVVKHGDREFVFFGDTFYDHIQCKYFLENPVEIRRCIPIQRVKHGCAEELDKHGVLPSLIRLCLSGASQNECISLLNKSGFHIFEQLPEGDKYKSV